MYSCIFFETCSLHEVFVYVLSEPRNVGFGQRRKLWSKTTLHRSKWSLWFKIVHIYDALKCLFKSVFQFQILLSLPRHIKINCTLGWHIFVNYNFLNLTNIERTRTFCSSILIKELSLSHKLWGFKRFKSWKIRIRSKYSIPLLFSLVYVKSNLEGLQGHKGYLQYPWNLTLYFIFSYL